MVNKFIYKLVFFFLIGYLFLSCLQLLIDTTLKKSEAEPYAQWNIIRKDTINADIIINGSSKAWTQFSTEILQNITSKKTYNLGLDGYGFFLQYLKFNLYKQNNKLPQLIIQVASTSTLSKREGIYRKNQFSPYFNDNEIFKDVVTFKGVTSRDKYIPLIKYSGEIKHVIQGTVNYLTQDKLFKSKLKNGYFGRDWGWDNSFDLFKKENPNGVTNKLSEKTILRFKLYLDWCVKNNIIVVLVNPPSYKESQDYIINYDEILSLYKKYSNNETIYFIDYSNFYLCYSKEYFYNSQHLNKKGSELFSKDISLKIQKIQGKLLAK
jgi:hypothetical protein